MVSAAPFSHSSVAAMVRSASRRFDPRSSAAASFACGVDEQPPSTGPRDEGIGHHTPTGKRAAPRIITR